MLRSFCLDDLCEKISDGSHNPPKQVEYSKYIMLSSKNILDNKITFDNPRYLQITNILSQLIFFFLKIHMSSKSFIMP